MIKRGDFVRLKGRKPQGVVKKMGKDDHWVTVQWDKGKEGPKYVHLYELDKAHA